MIAEGLSIPEPTLAEKLSLAVRHGELAVKYKDEYIAVKEMRKHIGWYFKGAPFGAKIRDSVNRVQTLEELKELLFGYLDRIFNLYGENS